MAFIDSRTYRDTSNRCPKRLTSIDVKRRLEEFRDIGLLKLGRTKLSRNIAIEIIEQVWNVIESKDIRDIVKIGNLVSTPEDVSFVVNMMKNKKC